MSRYEADSLSAGYCEFLTQVRPTGPVLGARAGLLLGTAALVITMLAVTLKTVPAVSFMLLVILLFCAWFLWQFTKIEYEYIIAAGEFELSKIYGARVRKKVLAFKTADISVIAPAARALALAQSAESLRFTCKKDDALALCLVYAGEDRAKHVLVIAAPDKTKACLKYYRRAAFEATE